MGNILLIYLLVQSRCCCGHFMFIALRVGLLIKTDTGGESIAKDYPEGCRDSWRGKDGWVRWQEGDATSGAWRVRKRSTESDERMMDEGEEGERATKFVPANYEFHISSTNFKAKPSGRHHGLNKWGDGKLIKLCKPSFPAMAGRQFHALALLPSYYLVRNTKQLCVDYHLYI